MVCLFYFMIKLFYILDVSRGFWLKFGNFYLVKFNLESVIIVF